MRILAVDTALGACSVAVLEGDAVLAHRFVAMERGHAEALAPMVEQAMHQSCITFSDLERLAVTTGPGTFTGQRVGLAFMRGLRVALKRPLIGITTLEAMCAAAMAEGGTSFAAAIHDAKRDEAYLAIASTKKMVLQPTLARLADVAGTISASLPAGSSISLAGTAALLVGEEMKGVASVSTVRQPDAFWVARLAQAAPEAKEPPQPLYLRAPDAKLPPPKS